MLNKLLLTLLILVALVNSSYSNSHMHLYSKSGIHNRRRMLSTMTSFDKSENIKDYGLMNDIPVPNIIRRLSGCHINSQISKLCQQSNKMF